MGWINCAPLDRVIALIAANKGDEGGCPVYGADKGDMENK